MWRRLHSAVTLLVMLSLAACATDNTVLTKASYAELPDWASDHHAQPLKLLADSCAANQQHPARAYRTKSGEAIGDAQGWQDVCRKVNDVSVSSDAAARRFFEENFTPYHVTSEQHEQGLITGYYEPVLQGSWKHSARYNVPVYGVPYRKADRYFSRAEIEAGALKHKAPVLLYVDDRVMLFFLQVQGSGKMRLPSGKLIGLQYAAQNGHPYVAIGKVLKDDCSLEVVNMQTIRDWLGAHSNEAAAIMNQNPSYVFFKLASGSDYAKGALGLPLTPLRSIAVDDARAAYGVPTYIATVRNDYTTATTQPLHRLFVSQDTGGALHGPHRADIFFGRGVAEEWSAGLQNAPGDVYWLLPNPRVPQAPLTIDHP